MKVNMMLVLITICFFTVIGIVGIDYYTTLKMAENGFHQCLLMVGENKFEVVWAKDCVGE